MIKLHVTLQESLQALSTIRHAHCQQGIAKHWRVDAEGRIRAQSVCWLFCWAATGQGSQTAATDAKEVFDMIFNQPYEWASRYISLVEARRLRYAKGHIGEEFRALLG
jgi:hypothetical protein